MGRRWRKAEEVPLVRVPGRGLRIGPRELDDRLGAPSRGLLPSLSALLCVEHPDADPHPDVAAFYEDTAAMRLACQPRWRPAFLLPALLFVALARAMQQLVLPLAARPHGVESRLAFLREPPLERAVASIRTYPDGGAMYVAVYAEHVAAGVRYMNIGMPLPLGLSLSSVLRGAPLAEGGLILTSRSGARPGHEGLWLVLWGGLRVRVPLHETLHAHAASSTEGRAIGAALPFSARGATMVATHRFEVFGLPCLELVYAIGPADQLEVEGLPTPRRGESGAIRLAMRDEPPAPSPRA